jgi:signal peptidase I
MIPTIRPGAYIIIRKPFQNASDAGIDVNKNGVYVFNKPPQHEGDSQIVFVKRCVGVPGDTIQFKRDELDPRYPSKMKAKRDSFYYPHSMSFAWTNNIFGPLWIPGKGRDVSLTPTTYILYGDIIRHEENTLEALNDTLFLINGKTATHYRFKQNYYFMLGDNFYESEDSRVFGLVPEKNMLGKVVIVL